MPCNCAGHFSFKRVLKMFYQLYFLTEPIIDYFVFNTLITLTTACER
jgi:hypothetical protein